jgi:hypothetical protein
MKTPLKASIVALLVAIVAFLTEPNSPFGGFWAPHPTVPQAAGAQLPLFMLLGAIEAIAFGVGVSFLVFGYSTLKASVPVSGPMARASHLSIAWLLMNWWPHDSLHLHNGLNLNGLLAIEYAFHVTLIIAGFILVRFFIAAVRPPAQVSVA